MKTLFFTFLLFVSVTLTAQEETFNRISASVGYGLHAPLSPGDKTDRSEFAGFGHFEVGLGYYFTKDFGVKVSYANDAFRDKNDSDLGINYNRIGLSAQYNLGKLVLPYYVYERVGIIAHTGIGYSRAKPVSQTSAEQTGNFTLGLRPQVKITERIAFFADGTYVVNFKQQYAFSGALFSPDFEDKTGSFATLSFGFVFYLGEQARHAEWY